MSDDINANRCRGEHAIKWLIPMLFSCLPLAGCALFVPGVHDLRLVNVEPVEVDTLDLHDSWGDMRPKMLPTDVVGRITIITEANIHDIAEQSELNTWYHLTICKSGGTVSGWPSIYYDGVDINYNSTNEAIQALYRDRIATHNRNEPYAYEIYFVPRSASTRDSLELCLSIGGGNMMGGHFVSNTVIIPTVKFGDIFRDVQR
jgi:hypothetical protein